ncbi:MAG: cobalamin-dependent protein [Proteobacteria bacterium]|nr:cobalamin-dependent protein [Pseudomonadota bacterium]
MTSGTAELAHEAVAVRPATRVAPANPLGVEEALARFAAPADCREPVVILRPFTVFSKQSYSTPIVPPIGPAYLASLLEAGGYAVEIIDGVGEAIEDVRLTECGSYKCQGLGAEQIIQRIPADARILGISMMFSQEWIHHRELINRIKRARPDLIIVAGGEHPTSIPEYVLRDCPAIDYVVSGEGELTFLELVHRLVSDADVSGMTGIAYLDENGTLVDTGLGRRLADVDALPRPAWHQVPVSKYFIGMFTHGLSMGRNMPILGTRGCPYQCTFCSNPTMWTTRYVLRDPAAVVDEIEWLMETYGANSIDFVDLTAIVKKKWITAFCDELKRRKLDIVWQLPSGTRSEALDPETLQALHDTGCRFLAYAPESASEETLLRIKKKIVLDHLTESAKTAVEVGHVVKIHLIIGFPGESRRSMWKTLLYSVKMAFQGIDDCNVAVFAPYPGSELFRELQETGAIGELNDQYFQDLIIQFDVVSLKTFNGVVPDWEIGFYRVASMATFYAVSYLSHPRRIGGLLRSLFSSTFQASSLLEQRLYDFRSRGRLRGTP